MKKREPTVVGVLTAVSLGVFGVITIWQSANFLRKYRPDLGPNWQLLVPGLGFWWLWRYCETLDFVTSGRINATLMFLLCVLLIPLPLAASMIQEAFNRMPLASQAAANPVQSADGTVQQGADLSQQPAQAAQTAAQPVATPTQAQAPAPTDATSFMRPAAAQPAQAPAQPMPQQQAPQMPTEQVAQPLPQQPTMEVPADAAQAVDLAAAQLQQPAMPAAQPAAAPMQTPAATQVQSPAPDQHAQEMHTSPDNSQVIPRITTHAATQQPFYPVEGQSVAAAHQPPVQAMPQQQPPA